MWLKWLKNILSGKAPPKRPQGRTGLRPTLEALEDRQLLSVSPVTAAAGVDGANRSYVISEYGYGLNQYKGGVFESQVVGYFDVLNPNGIAQVSAGTHQPPQPGSWFNFPTGAAFVRFNDGTVNEYYHPTGSGPWAALTIAKAGSGAREISASQVQADAMFVRCTVFAD
jgi:hypothetical protein